MLREEPLLPPAADVQPLLAESQRLPDQRESSRDIFVRHESKFDSSFPLQFRSSFFDHDFSEYFSHDIVSSIPPFALTLDN